MVFPTQWVSCHSLSGFTLLTYIHSAEDFNPCRVSLYSNHLSSLVLNHWPSSLSVLHTSILHKNLESSLSPSFAFVRTPPTHYPGHSPNVTSSKSVWFLSITVTHCHLCLLSLLTLCFLSLVGWVLLACFSGRVSLSLGSPPWPHAPSHPPASSTS